MILIGMFDSPFVRRVAVSMTLLDIRFEHRNWSVGKDFELIRQFNPLGPCAGPGASDGESLIDSTRSWTSWTSRRGRSGRSCRAPARSVAMP